MYYTGKGDNGQTSFGQGRLPKGEQIFELVGGIDELNSLLGLVLIHVPLEPVRERLLSIQNDLFTIGADLYYDFGGGEKRVSFREGKAKELESAINEMAKDIPPLTSFVIPGGSEAAAYLHVARAVCRRVEREAVRASSTHNVNPEILRYLNRLSSFFFVAALYCNAKLGVKEKVPRYSRILSAFVVVSAINRFVYFFGEEVIFYFNNSFFHSWQSRYSILYLQCNGKSELGWANGSGQVKPYSDVVIAAYIYLVHKVHLDDPYLNLGIYNIFYAPQDVFLRYQFRI